VDVAEENGVTPSFVAVRDRADDSRPEGRGKEVFVVINFTQGTQHVALPRELRALPGGLQESTLELPSNGIEELFVED